MKFLPTFCWRLLTGALAAVSLTPMQGLHAQNSTPAATLTNITQFSSLIGTNPSGAPIQAADGSFYGTTQNGGDNGYGAIYHQATDGTITVLYSFGHYDATANQPLDGSNPNTALIAGTATGTFYGTTPNGGTNGSGTIYRVVTDGTAAGTTFTVLHTFSYGTDGGSPQATLLRSLDGNLYGTTPNGGPVGNGTIFSLSTDGATFTVLYNFDSNAVGYNSRSPLIEGPAGTFYGTVQYDGPGGLGSLFKFTAANGVATTPVVLHAFNSYASGVYPQGNLILDNGVIYGTLNYGGPNYYGSIYAVSTDGTTRVNVPLYNFTNANSGYRPVGGLTLVGGVLYGTTSGGGANNGGTVFSAAEDGSALTILHAFTFTDGTNSQAPLALGIDGTSLYGTASSSGASNDGTLFQLSLDGTTFNVLNSFFIDYQDPEAALVQGADGTFYGTTQNGGAFNDGRVFRVDASGAITTLHEFSGTVGAPVNNNSLNRSGTTAAAKSARKSQAKANRSRTLRPAVTQPNVVTPTTNDGANPGGALIQGANGLFYGVTNNGGDNNNGTVFSVAADGTAYTVLHNFAAYTPDTNNVNADGSNPAGALVVGQDGNLYGVTNNGGASGLGVVYRLTPDGTGFALVQTFTGGQANPAYPGSGLTVGPDGSFYGATEGGGPYGNGDGTVYKISPDGATLTLLHAFTGVAPEGYRSSSVPVFGADGYLYGATYDGGNFNDGTVYKVSPDGATFTTLYNFSNVDGNRPQSALLASTDGYLYGTTLSGGIYGQGVIYRLSTAGDLSVVYNFSLNGGIEDDVLMSTASVHPTTAAVTTPPAATDRANGSTANLIQSADGFFYGTSPRGGTSDNGSVYRVSVTPVITSASGAAATVGTAFGFAVTAEHHPASFAASGLPTGLTIDPATGLINGTPTTTGTYPVILTATNDAGTASFTLTIIVQPATATAVPVVTSGAPPTGQVGTSYSYQIAASNAPTSYGASGLPAGLTINPATGLISGTPTAAGSYGVTILATNSGGTGAASFMLTILPIAPVISSAASANAVTGQTFSYQITASNNPTSFAATDLPQGLTINTTAGLISGTPTTAGTYAVMISATNAGGTSTARLNLVVSNAPVTTPVISSAANASAMAGQAFTYQITASNNPTSYSATGLPTGLTVSTATGLISGTPTVPGSYSVGLGATNAGGTGTATLALTVMAAMTPPTTPAITSPASASAQTGVAFTYQITASGNPTSFAATGLPGGLSVDPASGVISGTPTATGSFSVTLSATSATGTGTATLTLTVTSTAVTTPTVSSPASASAQVGQVFSYQVTASGNPTSFAATGLPGGLTINTATGLISGTPTAAGTFTVALSTTNAGGTSTASVNLTVTSAAVALPAINSAASASGQVAVAFSYQITASNNPVFFGATGLPAGLSINDATGVIAGTPTAAGTFTVTMMATNSAGTGTATLTLTIAAQPLPVISIIASIPQVTLGTGQLATFAVTRTGGDPTQEIAVNYSVAGTATAGVDYLTLKGVKTFKASKTTVRINVTPEGTLNGALKKTVKVTLQPGGGYTLGTATVARVKILPAP